MDAIIQSPFGKRLWKICGDFGPIALLFVMSSKEIIGFFAGGGRGPVGLPVWMAGLFVTLPLVSLAASQIHRKPARVALGVVLALAGTAAWLGFCLWALGLDAQVWRSAAAPLLAPLAVGWGLLLLGFLKAAKAPAEDEAEAAPVEKPATGPERLAEGLLMALIASVAVWPLLSNRLDGWGAALPTAALSVCLLIAVGAATLSGRTR